MSACASNLIRGRLYLSQTSSRKMNFLQAIIYTPTLALLQFRYVNGGVHVCKLESTIPFVEDTRARGI